MKSTILLFTILFTVTARAQEFQPPDTVQVAPKFWTHSLITSFTISQISFTDWSQGGENSFAYTASINGRSVYDRPTYGLNNAYKFAFGETRLGVQGIRKTDDVIDMEAVFSYKLGTYVNPYVAASFKSQFARGYRYEKDGRVTPVSKWFDPAFITQSIGAGFQIIPELRTRLGAALREIVTSEYRTYSDDPKTPDRLETIKVEDGVESVTDVQWKIGENILYTAKMELFSSFRAPEKVVARGDVTLSTKLGRIVTFNVNVRVINERAVTPRTQVKQSLNIGLSYNLL